MQLKRILIVPLFVLLATGCTQVPPDSVVLKSPTFNMQAVTAKGVEALRRGHYQRARALFAQGLRYFPTHCNLNFLNALSYQLAGRGGDSNQLGLAKTGYQLAMRFCPRDPWPYYFSGIIEMQAKDYTAAENLFKSATLVSNNQQIQPFMQQYLVAAVEAGDVKTAAMVSAGLSKMNPKDKFATEVYQLLSASEQLPAPQTAADAARAAIQNSEQSAAAPALPKPPPKKKVSKPREKEPLKKQLIVDAVIILNREAVTTRRGLNLLKGLQLQYGTSTLPGLLATYNHMSGNDWNQYIKNTTVGGTTAGTVFDGSFPQVPFSKLITNVISVTSVKYDLNIFNDVDEQDEILARPTLVAEDGQEANYFSGRKLIVGIEGTLTGTVQTFPIGLTMKITPYFLSDGSINLKINIGRDLLIPTTAATTFEQTAEELSENTETTVNVHYGETVILSALSEAIQSQTSNRTPILGNIPIVKYLFNQKLKEDEQTSVLFLLTPQRYASFMSADNERAIRQDMRAFFKHTVDPTTNLSRVLRDLYLMHLYHSNAILAKAFYDSATIAQALKDESSWLTGYTDRTPSDGG